jgi:hypothetical protein
MTADETIPVWTSRTATEATVSSDTAAVAAGIFDGSDACGRLPSSGNDATLCSNQRSGKSRSTEERVTASRVAGSTGADVIRHDHAGA